MKFNSWREAYEAQQKARTDIYDPLYLWGEYEFNFDFPNEFDIEATTDDEVVWLLTVDADGIGEITTQYGVGRNQWWYSVKFDHTGERTVVVENSLKGFYQLPSLITVDSRAKVIYENIGLLFEVYEFLANGKIEKEDEVSEAHLRNAERIKEFAMSQVENNDDEDSYDNDDWDVNDIEDEEDWDEDEEDYDDDFDDLSWDDEDDDFYDENDDYDDFYDDEDEDFDLDYEDDLDNVCQCGYDSEECDTLECDDSEESHQSQAKTGVYVVKFSVERDSERHEQLIEGTEADALETYYHAIDSGFKFVELSQVHRVHAILN
jgi:DNA-directed RNA polymerase subunit delta